MLCAQHHSQPPPFSSLCSPHPPIVQLPRDHLSLEGPAQGAYTTLSMLLAPHAFQPAVVYDEF